MSYEDQLYVWCLLLRNKLVGKIGPAHPKDNRALEYALLVPDDMAVDEINAITDVQITRKSLAAIVREFTDQAPPYSSFDKVEVAEGRPASAYGYEHVNGVPRWNNGGHRLAPEKPWLAQGVSRATWYRRRETLRADSAH